MSSALRKQVNDYKYNQQRVSSVARSPNPTADQKSLYSSQSQDQRFCMSCD